jgi:uncharacterized protein YdhG (YjbR/CyaY superfamily)
MQAFCLILVCKSKASMIKPVDTDSYIAGFPEKTQALLEQLRATIRETAPDAKEVISYAMPAFKAHGVLVYFAGYQHHIGFYPASAIAAFKEELAEFKHSKGAVQFPLDQPLPLELIKKMVRFRIEEDRQAAALKKSKK